MSERLVAIKEEAMRDPHAILDRASRIWEGRENALPHEPFPSRAGYHSLPFASLRC